jgi:hypothetical protein
MFIGHKTLLEHTPKSKNWVDWDLASLAAKRLFGQKLTFSESHFWTTLEVWQGAPSCMKMMFVASGKLALFHGLTCGIKTSSKYSFEPILMLFAIKTGGILSPDKVPYPDTRLGVATVVKAPLPDFLLTCPTTFNRFFMLKIVAREMPNFFWMAGTDYPDWRNATPASLLTSEDDMFCDKMFWWTNFVICFEFSCRLKKTRKNLVKNHQTY